MSTYIYVHNRVSEGANLLRNVMGVERLFPSPNNPRRLRADDVVINWGAKRIRHPSIITNPTGMDVGIAPRIINKPDVIAYNSDKLSFFRNCINDAALALYIPRFTTDRFEAEEWIVEGSRIVCRTVLTGHSGEGIVIADRVEDLVSAPLYVEYKKKKLEFRVHFTWNGVGATNCFLYQRKARSSTVADENVNWLIRNRQNGFIYTDRDIPEQHDAMLMDLTRTFANVSGLNFGALDIIWTERTNSYWLLEVNTAPGMCQSTAEKYADAFAVAGWCNPRNVS